MELVFIFLPKALDFEVIKYKIVFSCYAVGHMYTKFYIECLCTVSTAVKTLTV